MIVINLDIMLAKRKMSSLELGEKIGLTQANISILKTGKAKAIRFSTLDNICKALNCQPGDIIEYVDEEEVNYDEWRNAR
jgi:putative transcriptional regulator